MPDRIVKFVSQGLLDCTDITKEIYDLAKGEVEEVLLPVIGWVAVLGVVCLLAGGVCLGCYFYSRYYISDRNNLNKLNYWTASYYDNLAFDFSMNLIRDPFHMKITYQDSRVRLARIKIYSFSSSSQSSSSKNIV